MYFIKMGNTHDNLESVIWPIKYRVHFKRELRQLLLKYNAVIASNVRGDVEIFPAYNGESEINEWMSKMIFPPSQPENL